MRKIDIGDVVEVADGLGWPEGPTMLPDGRILIVECYRSQITAIDREGRASRYAYTAGAPNSCVLGTDGVYVCQNGGTVGPWRAKEMAKPSIQRIVESGMAETLVTEVEGIPLNGPNDLVFAPDGRLIFTDPGTYNPADPAPSYIHEIHPDGRARVLVAFPEPVFPNGIVVEADGSVVWDESYTGHVKRRRPDGSIEDLGRMPSERPSLDGIRIGADGRLYVTDAGTNGIHILRPDGTHEAFFECGSVPTNCTFDGETLWVTNAGVLATGTEPSFGGTLARLRIPGGGAPTHHGRIAIPGR
ncbi:MAG: SMP-30/gluconolactonase/LRE family protein [Rhizobiales bacterium]|nr:SMP-30/gluconolactonase/LRE family protein [Hyphomicrobiales bacterium]